MSAGQARQILHFADLHLGLERYSGRADAAGLFPRTLDTLRALDALISDARTQPPDVILFAGDAYHSSQPGPNLQRAFAERVLALAEIAPLVLLVGQHDAPAQPEHASSLAIFATLPLPRVHVAMDFSIQSLQCKGGPITLATAPHHHDPAKIAAEIPKLAAAAAGDAPRVLLAHTHLSEAATADERPPQSTLPQAALANPAWDYVALGAIHRHQELGDDDSPPLVYPGSLQGLDFSAAAEEKGYIRAEIARGRAEWRLQPLPSRAFLRIAVDLRDADDPLLAFRDAIADCDITGAIVRPDLRLTREQDAKLTERALRQLLRAAGAEHIAASQRELSGPVEARLQEISADPSALLAQYWQLREKARGQAFTKEEKEGLNIAAQEIWAELANEE